MAIRYTETNGAITFPVRVVARASKTEIVGEHDGALKLRIAAPPVDGAANEELVRFLARTLHIPARAILIVAGHASKLKTVRVEGMDADKIPLLRECLDEGCKTTR